MFCFGLAYQSQILYSSCIGCHLLRWWYFNCPLSWYILFFASLSSAVHHHFMYGLGFVSLMCFLTASWIASFRVLSLLSNISISSISAGGGRLARLALRVSPAQASQSCENFVLPSMLLLAYVCQVVWRLGSGPFWLVMIHCWYHILLSCPGGLLYKKCYQFLCDYLTMQSECWYECG